MEDNEKEIKEYVLKGGELFTITFIDIMRDGGTKIIRTTKDNFYVDKDYNMFHSSYPISYLNIITNSLQITYLIDRIQSYIEHCERGVERNKKILIDIKNNKK